MRNRAEGWRYAKLSGHKNEKIIAKRIEEDEDFRSELENRIGLYKITNVICGGLKEKSVTSVIRDKTKSKTDIIVEGKSKNINISIKKSKGGQAYLIGVNRFVEAMNYNYGSVPEKVKRSLELLFSQAKDISTILENIKVTGSQNQKLMDYQRRKNRLVWISLQRYNNDLADITMDWFKKNIEEIAEICFSRGLAKNKKNWADFVWYENLLKDEDQEINRIISIDKIKSRSKKNSNDQVKIGKRLGGSTIQLPFGFLQWHQAKMQFHHRYDKIF